MSDVFPEVTLTSQDASWHPNAGMVNGNKYSSSLSAQKILLLGFMIIFTTTLGHSNPAEDKTMIKNGLIATKNINISLNSIENKKITRKRQSKSLEKVRKRKKKSGSYYPIQDEQSKSPNSISSSTQPPGSEKEEHKNKLKNNQNLTKSKIENLETILKTNTSQEDTEQIIPIKLNLEYVDFNRETRDDTSIKDDLLTLPAVGFSETSRSLPSARKPTVRGLDNFITTRTSSRTLFPPHRRTYSVTSSSRTTPHPTSFFTAKTPEFNHVSFLTHPSTVTKVRDNNRKSFQDKNFQTNFGEKIINVVDDIILGNAGEKTAIRASRIPKNGFQSFFTLGAPRETNPTTTTTTTTTTTIKPKSFQEKDFQVNPWTRDAFHTEVFK